MTLPLHALNRCGTYKSGTLTRVSDAPRQINSGGKRSAGRSSAWAAFAGGLDVDSVTANVQTTPPTNSRRIDTSARPEPRHAHARISHHFRRLSTSLLRSEAA